MLEDIYHLHATSGNTPLLGKTDDFIYFSGHFGGHLAFWRPDCNANFSIGFAALDNPYNVVLGDSMWSAVAQWYNAGLAIK